MRRRVADPDGQPTALSWYEASRSGDTLCAEPWRADRSPVIGASRVTRTGCGQRLRATVAHGSRRYPARTATKSPSSSIRPPRIRIARVQIRANIS